VNIEAVLRCSSSAHPPLLHCEQRTLRQRKVARLAYDSEHGKLWQDIKADLDKTRARASKFAHDAEWAFGKRTARVLGVVTLFAVVVALLLVFLDWYVAPTKPSERKNLVLAVAQILAGTALLSGLYLMWRTLQVNREGQITERFTRAIDQLGSKELEIRLGGIYALERIARDSEQYHWSIMEVLTAYVRQHAPWSPEEGKEGTKDAAEEKIGVGLAADIQAIMTVIGRRTRFYLHGEPERLDLLRTNLAGANLKGANLVAADLEGANLSRANLATANLWGAMLQGANLRSAFLWETNLSRTFLEGVNLSKASFVRVDLSKRGTSPKRSWKRRPQTNTPCSLHTSSAPRIGAGRLTNRSRRTEPHSRTSEKTTSTQ
jgi:hypothetical protein